MKQRKYTPLYIKNIKLNWNSPLDYCECSLNTELQSIDKQTWHPFPFWVSSCISFRLQAFSTHVCLDLEIGLQFADIWSADSNKETRHDVKMYKTFIQFVPYLQNYKYIETHCNAFLWHEPWNEHFCKMLCIFYCMMKIFSKLLKTFYVGKFWYQSWSVKSKGSLWPKVFYS